MLRAECAAAGDWLRVEVTEQRLLVDIARGYDVLIMGADKWAQVNDPHYYDDDPAHRDAAIAALPELAIAPRPPLAVPERWRLDVADEHAAVSSSAVRAGHRGVDESRRRRVRCTHRRVERPRALRPLARVPQFSLLIVVRRRNRRRTTKRTTGSAGQSASARDRPVVRGDRVNTASSPSPRSTAGGSTPRRHSQRPKPCQHIHMNTTNRSPPSVVRTSTSSGSASEMSLPGK